LANGKYNVQKELKKWLSDARRVVVAGIGNPIRMDDFVGVKIVQDLQGKVSERVYLIECETVPESFIQQIIDFKPSHVLLIDAALLGLEPGDAKLINPNQLTVLPAFSTHMLPLRIFCEYLVKTTDAKIALLLIEPEATDFGEGLTPIIEASAQGIARALLNFL
jgi:hydrogenase 3 maturation protease